MYIRHDCVENRKTLCTLNENLAHIKYGKNEKSIVSHHNAQCPIFLNIYPNNIKYFITT